MTWLLTVVLLSAVVLAGCLAGPTSSVDVSITEGPWSVDPPVVGDAAGLDFHFDNRGSEVHHPLVLSTNRSPEEVAAALADRGTADVVLELVTPDTSSEFHILADIATEGHFHPPERPELPDDALVHPTDDEEIVGFLYTDAVEPGTERTDSATAGKPGDTYGRTTFVVMCMNLEHGGRAEYAIFEVVP